MPYDEILKEVRALIERIQEGDAPGEGSSREFAVGIVRKAVDEIESEEA